MSDNPEALAKIFQFYSDFSAAQCLKASCCHSCSWEMGMAFPISLCIIVVVIFSSIFMKNVLLAHKNSIASAYHSVAEHKGLISPTG